MPAIGLNTGLALAVLHQHIGGCREETPTGKCWQPAEFVLWGKLIPNEGLHVGHHALASRSGYALIKLSDLAYDLTAAENS